MAEHVMAVASYCYPHKKNSCLLMPHCFCCITNSKKGQRKWMMYYAKRKVATAPTRKGEIFDGEWGGGGRSQDSKVALQTCWTT